MRKIREIQKEEGIAFEKVWYDRHQVGMQGQYLREKNPEAIKCIKGGIKAAKKMRKKYGKKNLGPYSKFEWGMLNGRLETLRWILGDEWGNLDT